MSKLKQQTINDIKIDGKQVVLRTDYNVPLGSLGEIIDDFRLRQSLPTIEFLLEKKCSLVILSHLGRPKGQFIASLSLAPVVRRLRQLLPETVIKFASDCHSQKAKTMAKNLSGGQILVLENTRFYPGETANDEAFGLELSSYGEIFVQDCFGALHRSHASTVGIAKHLPSVAGLLVKQEVAAISDITQRPKRPLGLVVGGAKVTDKLPLLKRFMLEADFIAIVGALANNFLVATGYSVGKSLVDDESVKLAKEIYQQAQERQTHGRFELFLSPDYLVTTDPTGCSETRLVDLQGCSLADILAYPNPPTTFGQLIEPNEMIVDIGPLGAHYIAGAISRLGTVVWNGTAGLAEVPGLAQTVAPFSHGTRLISLALSRSYGPTTLVGGGDTVGYLQSSPGLADKFDHVSTGGGACLAMLSGQKLPGLEVLKKT